MARPRHIAWGVAVILVVGCEGGAWAQRSSPPAGASTPDGWATDWAAFVRAVESQRQKPAAEFAAFIKQYEDKQVRWIGTVEWATCQRGRCVVTLKMTPDSVKLSPRTAAVAQILLRIEDPGRTLTPRAKVAFRTTLSPPVLGRRGARVMVYTNGGEILPDLPR